MKKYDKISFKNPFSWVVKVRNKDFKKLLNLNFTTYTNQTYSIGKYDFPYISCKTIIYPDYLALYSEVQNYNKTPSTCVCFYQYDFLFDGINGLFSAIYYNDKRLLNKFRERFKDVRYFISPDYSQCGDINRIENLYRLFKARIVSLWLILEMGSIVIPNITYADENYFEYMLDGMENCNVVAFSVKGSMREVYQKELLIKAIKYTVDKMKNLSRIIVYSSSTNDEVVLELFSYATYHGIEVIIPNNILRERNMKRKVSHCG